MRAVVFEGAGGNEVVAVKDRPDPKPGDHEILVEAAYAGINPADVLQRAGRYPAPAGSPDDIPGLEVAGHVVATGSGVTRWREGDRVMGIVGGGGLADRVLVHEGAVCEVSAHLDDQQAAAIPEVFITAHDALVTQGTLAPGETVLVQGATGGVGTAAMQLAAAAGCEVLGVTRSAAGRALVEELGAKAIDDADFVEQVRERVDGVDVILELVGAPHFPGNLKLLRTGARIVVVGVGAGQKVEVPLLALMGNRARLIGTVLRARSTEEKAAAVAAFAADVLPQLASGAVRPLVDEVFPLSDVHAAFDRLEGEGKRGKLLLDLRS